MSRGLFRLAAGAAVLWFVFWTLAYVLAPHRSEMMTQAAPFTLGTDLVLLATLVGLVPWIVAGFGSKEKRRHVKNTRRAAGAEADTIDISGSPPIAKALR
jgi:hypothetical protein